MTRKYDGDPYQLAKGKVEAWCYNDPKTIEIFIRAKDSGRDALSIRVPKKKLKKLAGLP